MQKNNKIKSLADFGRETEKDNRYFFDEFPVITIELGSINLKLAIDKGRVLHVIRSDGIENLDFDEREILLYNAMNVIHTYKVAWEDKSNRII